MIRLAGPSRASRRRGCSRTFPVVIASMAEGELLGIIKGLLLWGVRLSAAAGVAGQLLRAGTFVPMGPVAPDCTASSFEGVFSDMKVRR